MCVLKFNQEAGKQHVEVYEQDKHVDASCIVPYYIYKDTLENNRWLYKRIAVVIIYYTSEGWSRHTRFIPRATL